MIEVLHKAAAKALQDPDVIARMGQLSASIVASTPEEQATHVKAELAKWEPIVKASGVQMD